MADCSLSEIQSGIWQSLADATVGAGSAWRVFSLATIDAESRPHTRMVVLRGVDEKSRELLLFTDPRTPKWRELLDRPRAEVLFWNPEEKIQLRCQCWAKLHKGDEMAARYQAEVPIHMAGDYAAGRKPGSVMEEASQGGELGEEWNFGVVVLTVVEMDWLQLRREGHQRAAYRWDGKEWAMNWTQP